MIRNSIKQRVILLDLLLVLPLFLIFSIIILAVFRKSNYELNYSKLSYIEEKCSNIANRNVEIIKITNMLYLDTDINRMVSKKQQPSDYEYIANQNMVYKKMVELTESFPDRQYQIMLLCDNGSSYYQASLGFEADALNAKKLQQEEWYQEIEKENDAVYFLPRYRSKELQKLFEKDTLFAVRNIRNLNSGRHVGMIIVAVSENIWGENSIREEDTVENSMVIDQFRKIIFSSDSSLYETDVADNHYYEKIVNNEKGFFLGNVNGQFCHIRFSEIGDTGWKYITYEPYKRSWSVYVICLLILSGAVVAVITLIVLYNCNYISRRVNRLNHNMLEVAAGNLKTRMLDDYEIEFKELSQNFNGMLNRIEDLMRKLEKEEQEKHILEIQALQAQINPHFFYNTLVTIRFMIQMEQYKEADMAILAFSKLLRKSFAYNQKWISIGEELEFTEEYLKLMSLRDKDKFRWNIAIEECVKNLGILKNMVQPLVENSISHGFNMKTEQGTIWIRAYQLDETVIIEVEDDGVGADISKINKCIQSQEVSKAKEQFNGIGISNIQMRIKKNFGSDFGLQAEMNSHGGTTFRMKIPVLVLGGKET